ncbi:DNA-directed RNA polymerase core subunit rpc10 [Dispira parvispora]|uniref:DNA-directed RNA polymerase core subunit rpc10 n=1 Tax=Dispira parvispora TaxID=1520584 RepID=A0A9W8AVL3_9FUNG|nr:DNA-directed RNA polymerase core subunit rpc10 [Dispira parvispora]
MNAGNPPQMPTTGMPISMPVAMVYLCADCGEDNEIKPKEPIRCRTCGHRVLYKKRTARMVQFEAR